MLVVLDIDETLIHATKYPIKFTAQPDFEFMGYNVYLRPKLELFLIKLQEEFDIGVWSSASDKFVEGICERIFQRQFN